MLSKLLSKLLPKLPKSVTTEFRIVKENIYDEIALDMDTVYYIQKRNGLSWVNVNTRKFSTQQEAEQYYSVIQKYLKDKELTYTYLKNK